MITLGRMCCQEVNYADCVNPKHGYMACFRSVQQNSFFERLPASICGRCNTNLLYSERAVFCCNSARLRWNGSGQLKGCILARSSNYFCEVQSPSSLCVICNHVLIYLYREARFSAEIFVTRHRSVLEIASVTFICTRLVESRISIFDLKRMLVYCKKRSADIGVG